MVMTDSYLTSRLLCQSAHKIPQTGGLETDIYFPAVLGGWQPRSKGRQGCLVRLLSVACRQPALLYVPTQGPSYVYTDSTSWLCVSASSYKDTHPIGRGFYR